MREIKFRVWDKENKEMYFSDSSENYGANNSIVDMEINHDVLGWCVFVRKFNNNNYQEVKKFEMLQYTGLKDKNGKEIYEGDIIQFTWDSDSCWGKAGTYIGYIRFDGGVFEVVYIGKVRERRIKEETENYDDIKRFMDWSEDIKVIGNIYERPELLEGQK